MGARRWSAEQEAAEIARRAQADANLVRSEADLYAAERRRDADQLVAKARAQLAGAKALAAAIEEEAQSRAETIVQDAELRARDVAREIVDGPQHWFAGVVERATASGEPTEPPIVILSDRGSDVVIDLRPRPATDKVDDVLGPNADQLDRLLETAVQRAVKRTFGTPVVRAGRYAS